ncbi:PAS domain S-box protein [Lutibacter sp.]|uniref:PAS domain S-box protein n=1 Tax=Lutibacter sp. TaxID=1925666 RepID=UPI0025C380EC|nr:PAS domain S-box protein [Lutibacter sp.]MCF6167950.1 PAS domain S-box protein [Lutibacter sp.]
MKNKYTYKELKQELYNARKRLKEIQQIAHLGDWELDIINNKLIWSDETYRIFNLNPQEIEISYEKFLALIHPEDKDMVNKTYLKSLKNKTSYSIEHRILLPLGEVKYVVERGKTYYNDEGIPTHSIGTIIDITNRYELKDTLRKSEEKYRAIVENTSEWIWEMDGTGVITYSNSVVEQILGYSKSELIGKNNISLINKLDRERVAKVFLKKTELKESWENLELRWSHKEGGYRYLESSAIPIFNNEGIFQGFRGVNRDITKRKEAEQKLEERERNFRELFEKSGDALLIIKNGIFIDCNQATVVMLNFKSKEAFLNSHPSELSPELQPDGLSSTIKAEEMMALALNNGTHRFEWIHTKSDGELFPVEVLLTAISNEPNKKIIHCVWRDITERKKVDEALNESLEFTRAITQSAPNAIITINFEGFILSWNKTAEKIFGYTSFEMINKSIQNIIPALEISKHKKTLSILNNIRKENLFGKPIQLQGVRKDGTKFLMELSLSSWNVGAKKCYTGIIRDITESKQAEAENKKLSTVVEQSVNTIIITDINGEIEYVNPRFTEVSGFTAKEALGNYPRILKSGKHTKEFYTQLWKTIKSGKTWKGEFQNKAKNGKLFWEQATITPIKNEEGEIINYLSIREDITIQKKAEKELNIALIKAKESDKLKSIFLASMSHEIRTPMNSIIGFSEFLLESNLPENKRKDYAEIIITNSKQLLAIVNDILDFSKIEAGVVQLNYQSIDLNKMLNDLYVFYKPIAIESNLMLTCKLGLENAKSIIDVDSTKLNQILTNLLSNAIKFTNEGEVEFGYKLIKNNLQFYVKDTGEGIDEKLKNKIFDRFFQGNLDLVKQHTGTGLGLAISKNFVELFHGKIWFTSNEKGTTFYFTIPYTKNKTPVTPTDFTTKKEQIKQGITKKTKETIILVAEDEEYNMMYINVLFSKTNFKIIEANNGKQAVEMFKKNPEVDLVLMDIQMPIMDGNEAMKEIKKIKPSTPVIALSAFAMESDKEKALKKGFDFYISKPIDKKLLFNTIKEYSFKLKVS